MSDLALLAFALALGLADRALRPGAGRGLRRGRWHAGGPDPALWFALPALAAGALAARVAFWPG